jgi:hypothetical protein
VEISTYNTSTKRNPNQAPFDKISKSGDGGPGRPLDDVIRSVAEKRLDEDVYHIEQLSSSAK